jgi:hypothetical protein
MEVALECVSTLSQLQELPARFSQLLIVIALPFSGQATQCHIGIY